MNWFSRLAITTVLFAYCSPAWSQDPFQANIRPTDPLTPQEELESFTLPRGFEIQLVASEPDIYKPMNLAFDTKGRLWVTDSTEYPFAVGEGETGRDSVKILEDADGDGFAEKVTTFADGLNIPIGLCPYKNGCIVFSIPYIWWLEDTDGDDVADRRIPLYGPMGFERDTHGLNNSFRRGFDGWMYACHGFNNETSVAGNDGHRVEMQSGNTYRFSLDGEHIRQFTWGQVNPFGMTVDAMGNLFTADCHSKPIYQLLPGGRYPSFGKPHDGLGFVTPMMDHLHGSTAIAGLTLYEDDRFPEAYRQNFFSGNVMTSRVNRNSIRYDGSTPVAIEKADFVVSDDPWFRPVDVRMGPDGALYIADFYNRIIGHYEVDLLHEGRDRHRGRIWRVVYRGDSGESLTSLASTSMEGMDIEQLIEFLAVPNLQQRLLAMNHLCDSASEQNRSEMLDLARKAFESSASDAQRAHCLWVLYRVGGLEQVPLPDALDDSSALVRTHALRVLADLAEWATPHEELVVLGLADSNPQVRRTAIEALSWHRLDGIVQPLLDLSFTLGREDPHLAYMIRRAIQYQLMADSEFSAINGALDDLSEFEMAELATICQAVPSLASSEFLLRYLDTAQGASDSGMIDIARHIARHSSVDQVDRLVALARARLDSNPAVQLELIQSIRQSLSARGEPSTAELTQWAEQLTTALLVQAEPHVGHWQNIPVSTSTRRDNPWVVERRRSSDGDQEALFLGSLSAGEQATGRLRSEPFHAPEQLSFYVAGHVGHPALPPSPINAIRLIDAQSEEVLMEAAAPRNDVAQRIEWDLGEFVGKECQIEIIDRDQRNAYAWIAAGRFDPAVVEVPALAPRLVATQLQSILDLVDGPASGALHEQFLSWIVAPQMDVEVRRQIAQHLGDTYDEPRKRALVPIIGDADVSETTRLRIANLLVNGDAEVIDVVMEELFAVLTSGTQRAVLLGLSGTAEGQNTIVELIANGSVDNRLLLDAPLGDAIGITGNAVLVSNWEDARASAPPLSETLDASIAERVAHFREMPGDPLAGHEVFKQRCANCHQVAGEGKEIGPQLDGIGQRGVLRVVEDVLDPNRNVDAAFRSTTIVTLDGEVLVGLFRRQDGQSLVFVDREGNEFRLAESDIEEQQVTPSSLMPNDIASEMSNEEFADLMAFLLRLRAESAEDLP